MAEFTRTNGWAVGGAGGEQVGRDIKFVKCAATGLHTYYALPGSNFEKAVNVLAKYCTITVVGTPAADNCVFMVEGLPTKVGDSSADQSGGTAIATKLATDADAANGLTSTWTIYNGLSGATFG
jgi:hypothetical protein